MGLFCMMRNVRIFSLQMVTCCVRSFFEWDTKNMNLLVKSLLVILNIVYHKNTIYLISIFIHYNNGVSRNWKQIDQFPKILNAICNMKLIKGSFKYKWSWHGTHGFGCMASQSFRNVDFSNISEALIIKKNR